MTRQQMFTRKEGKPTKGIVIPKNARVIKKVNFEDALRLIAKGYVMRIHSAPSAEIMNLDISNTKEVYLKVEKERSLGPIEDQRLLVNLTHKGVNTSDGELEISHTFSEGISNESSYANTRALTHTGGAQLAVEAKFKVPVLGEATSTTTLSYEYSNTSEEATSQSQTVNWQYQVEAKGTLPPHTSGILYTKLYTTKTRYEQTGYSYFQGSISFDYLIDLPGAEWNHLDIDLKHIGGRIDDTVEQQVYENYYMYFSSYEDPNGELQPSLAYNGLFYLDVDDSYYAETGLTPPEAL